MAAIGRNRDVDHLSQRYRVLRYAASFFAASLVVHGADHLRRGVAVVTPEVFWGGLLLSAAGLATVLLVFRGHRLARPLAVVVGFATAFGVTAAHLLPPWSVLSDSFVTGDADLLSWVVVLAEIGGAFALGVAGARAPSGGGGDVSPTGDFRLRPPAKKA